MRRWVLERAGGRHRRGMVDHRAFAAVGAGSIMPSVAGFKGVSLQFPVGFSKKDFAYVAENLQSGHVDPKAMIKNGLSAPLHPGAVKFYKEKGWI